VIGNARAKKGLIAGTCGGADGDPADPSS
jgi:hypothetical protein